MKEKVLMTDITGKMAAEGDRLLGYIRDVVIDSSSGLMKYLVLETFTEISDMTDEDGRAVIPVSSMRIEQKYVIVKR
jgi:sporulation protein YlmC with PRC-barrel domain